jgi:hypothetical protein
MDAVRAWILSGTSDDRIPQAVCLISERGSRLPNLQEATFTRCAAVGS